MKYKVTVVAKEIGGGEFCFYDFTGYSDNPEDLCIDWSQDKHLMYESRNGNPYGQLSKAFLGDTTNLMTRVILPAYSENCMPLPEASRPKAGPGEGVYQGIIEIDPASLYTECPELAAQYADKTEL